MPFEEVPNYANDLVAYTTRPITTTHIGLQAVVPHADRLDVRRRRSGNSQRRRTATERTVGKLDGWWRILSGVAGATSGVAAMSRDPNKLDVFIVGTEGAVWTAAWDANVANGRWRGGGASKQHDSHHDARSSSIEAVVIRPGVRVPQRTAAATAQRVGSNVQATHRRTRNATVVCARCSPLSASHATA